MPHALTEDHSIEDSQIRHAGGWPAPVHDARAALVRTAAEPAAAIAGEEDGAAPAAES